MMKKILFYTVLTFPLAGMMLNACKKPETPDPVNEEELITTLSLAFTDTATMVSGTFVFQDTDGPGGNDPETFDTIRLLPGKVYAVAVTLLNESVTPADDITIEVLEEGVDHQVFYTVTDAAISFTYADTDDNGNPLGLMMTAETGAVSTGTVTITLKHQPGTKDGNITTGETDVEVSFLIEIE